MTPTDINECEVRDACQHECMNTPGSHRCLCPTGYRLMTNGKTCQGESPQLLFVSSHHHHLIVTCTVIILSRLLYVQMSTSAWSRTSSVEPTGCALTWEEVTSVLTHPVHQTTRGIQPQGKPSQKCTYISVWINTWKRKKNVTTNQSLVSSKALLVYNPWNL